MSQPLAVDLFCGLGGWAEGLLAEGYFVAGFDIERHRYPGRDLPERDIRKVHQSGVNFNNPKQGSSVNRSFNYANECAVRDAPLNGAWLEYPGNLVIQDVSTLHGSQFKDAALIVASPPCQEYSYMAMPWTRSKAKAAAILADTTGAEIERLNRLFNACFRIQREACEAAGHHIPMIVENVRGAIPWVGRSRWSFGSYYLWGDVPALMPAPIKAKKFNPDGTAHPSGRGVATDEGRKHHGDWFRDPSCPSRQGGQLKPPARVSADPPAEGRKGAGAEWFDQNTSSLPSSSIRRKQASAMIAKIPLALSTHIARTFYPR